MLNSKSSCLSGLIIFPSAFLATFEELLFSVIEVGFGFLLYIFFDRYLAILHNIAGLK